MATINRSKPASGTALKLNLQSGRGGMGSTKHGKSGFSPRSPRYKHNQTLEANKVADELAAKRHAVKPKMFASVKEAFSSIFN